MHRAQVFLAIGDSFFSGTDKAILYESIQELGEADEALRGESRAVYYSQLTESVASVFGGYIATWFSLRAAIQVTALPYIAGSILTLFLLDTHKPPSRTLPVPKEALNLTGIRQDFSNPIVGGLMSVLCILGVSTYMGVWFYQPLWARGDLPLPYYGWSWAALNLSVAFSALLAVHFEVRRR